VKVHRLQPRTHEPVLDLPPLSLEPPSLTLVRPAPLLEPAPETAHVEPDWRGRTARTQYRDSEIYQPLSSMLLGGRVMRATLLVAFLLACNAAIGWLAWQAWGNTQTTNDQAIIVGAGVGGLLAGWILAVVERRYRLRRRFTFKT
jgi:hypothetical protein